MKLFLSIVLAAVITMFVIPEYSYSAEKIFEHNVNYNAWVCAWCSDDVRTTAFNFPATNDSDIYKAWYQVEASGLLHAKVNVVFTYGGQTSDIRLTSSEPKNDLEILKSNHPVTIKSIVKCQGAGSWEDVTANIKVYRTLRK
jgi:hypothetical protein